jgi:phospholipid-binding lipoprotein MlaA
MRGGERGVAWVAAAALTGLVSACAGAPRDASLPIDDPNEQFNRKILQVNQTVLDPAANVVKQVPGPIRDRLEDLDQNLKEPRVLANNILQGRFNAAGITVGRIIFNTTFGLGGLFDVATAGGLPHQSGDFGQTLFVWGVPAGTFVETPYFGPGTQRDSFGGAVDTVADPVGWVLGGILIGWPWSVGAGGLSATAHLAQWKEAENASIDFYSFLRSDWYQTRRGQLREALGLPPVTESPATASPAASGPSH